MQHRDSLDIDQVMGYHCGVLNDIYSLDIDQVMGYHWVCSYAAP